MCHYAVSVSVKKRRFNGNEKQKPSLVAQHINFHKDNNVKKCDCKNGLSDIQ